MFDLSKWLGSLTPKMWMPDPSAWVWQTPRGTIQGFGCMWQQAPGTANLLWLVMDMQRPPSVFDARTHQPYMLMATHARANAQLERLAQLAASALPDFREALDTDPAIATIAGHDLSPLLILLADRRARHANVG